MLVKKKNYTTKVISWSVRLSEYQKVRDDISELMELRQEDVLSHMLTRLVREDVKRKR